MNGQPMELLLVEDNPDDVALTLHVFERYKLANNIRVARDGAEALEYLFGAGGAAEPDHLPKVVLLDLKLPKVSGLEVLARIKADPRTKSIPVVVVTSSHEDRDLQQAYELGVNSYLVKPVDFSQFTECIRQLGLYWLVLNQRPPIKAEDFFPPKAAGR